MYQCTLNFWVWFYRKEEWDFSDDILQGFLLYLYYLGYSKNTNDNKIKKQLFLLYFSFVLPAGYLPGPCLLFSALLSCLDTHFFICYRLSMAMSVMPSSPCVCIKICHQLWWIDQPFLLCPILVIALEIPSFLWFFLTLIITKIHKLSLDCHGIHLF